jgi:hypothetical protein
MKKSDIISRIKEIVREKRTNGVLELLDEQIDPKTYIKKSLYIRGDKLYYIRSYRENNNSISETYPEKRIYKFKLAAILFEIGDDNDRSLVKNDMLMSDFAYLINKLGIVKQKLKEIRDRKNKQFLT